MQTKAENIQVPPIQYAFFDVDGTILKVRSMLMFQDFYHRNASRVKFFGVLNAWRNRAWWSYNLLSKRDRHLINKEYYESFRGIPQAKVQELAQVWYDHEKGLRPDLFVPSTIRAIKEHQAKGIKVVLVSGSFQEILQPLAREIGAHYCLATVLETHDGYYTGKITPPQMIGKGKAEAIRTFLQQVGANSALCFAYGDHHTDIPMLEVVGTPVAIKGDPALEGHAVSKGWEILSSD